jgi:hypothetical protein
MQPEPLARTSAELAPWAPAAVPPMIPPLVPPTAAAPLELVRRDAGPEQPRLLDADLDAFARFLAQELQHDQAAAVGAPIMWYRAQVGEDICGRRDAYLLRWKTIERSIDITRQRIEQCRRRRDVSMRDFGREDVRDAEANRARRAALLAQLPNRLQLGVVPAPAAPPAGKGIPYWVIEMVGAALTLAGIIAYIIALH